VTGTRPVAPDRTGSPVAGAPGAAPGPPAAATAGDAVAVAALEGVVAAYRERVVLRGVDLAVASGERVALVGPNGAGKSTLLRVLAGLVPPSRGTVTLGGDAVATLDRPAIARRLAAVPGQVTFPFSARVEDVVALGRLPHEDPFRGPRAADRAAVDAAISRVGIDRLRGRDARELSLGERQLVLVALAVAQAAPLLVLDEPTVHLDLRHQVAVMELLADLNERDGTTVLAVLHDLSLARHFFPRLAVLDGGRIVADGAPDRVLTRERVRAVFGVDVALTGAPSDG
jgi:ABC-type cobalamin/Fe3+-siderophores transport system ATPase subunit